MGHADEDPVIFGYNASCNIGFQGSEDSGYTWGEWRAMSADEKQDAYSEFVWNNLGVDVFPEGDES